MMKVSFSTCWYEARPIPSIQYVAYPRYSESGDRAIELCFMFWTLSLTWGKVESDPYCTWFRRCFNGHLDFAVYGWFSISTPTLVLHWNPGTKYFTKERDIIYIDIALLVFNGAVHYSRF